MQKEIRDGIFVIAGPVIHLLISELVKAAGDGLFGLVQARGGVSEEVVGDGVRRHAAILRRA